MVKLTKVLLTFSISLCSPILWAQSPINDDSNIMVSSDKSSEWHINTPTKPVNDDALLFPVTSSLTQGKVTTIQVNLPNLSQPIFVIGDDVTSIAWTTEHADALKTIHAIGLLTNTQTTARWHAIEQQTGLTLIPASLDGLGDVITVSHYPFLLSKDWLEQ